MVVALELITPEVHNILCEVQICTMIWRNPSEDFRCFNNHRRSMNFLAATRQHWWHGMWADDLGNPFWVQCCEGDLYTRPTKFDDTGLYRTWNSKSWWSMQWIVVVLHSAAHIFQGIGLWVELPTERIALVISEDANARVVKLSLQRQCWSLCRLQQRVGGEDVAW